MAIGTSFQDAILLETSIQSGISPNTPNIYFQINVTEGVLYSFTTLSGDDFDLVAYLYDSNGNQITSDDDSGEGYNPLIKFAATYTGKMFVMVRAYGSGYTIPFEAHLSEAQAIPGDNFNSAIQIEPGRGLTVSLIPNVKETYFKANLKNGSKYRIESKTDYDLRVFIYDSALTQYDGDDDSGENYNFLCNFTAETSLIYFRIYSYSQIEEGANVVTIDLTEADSGRVDGVSVYPNSAMIRIGATIQLRAEVTPATAIDKSVIWESGDESIAIVDASGLVTAIGFGSVQINATTTDGGFTHYMWVSAIPFDGSGTTNDPFLIRNAMELNYVRDFKTANFKQIDDIDLEGVEFEPIRYGGALSGSTYDGNGYKIKNLKINKPDDDEIGLFGYLSYGVIKNLTVENADVIGKKIVGGLLGSLTSNSSLINCHVINGSVRGYQGVGGLVGEMMGDVESCSSSGYVEANNRVGGSVGITYGGTISKTFSTSEVYCDDTFFGGLVGFFSAVISPARGSEIYDSYSTGTLRTNEVAILQGTNGGGLVGHSQVTPLGIRNKIHNCYTTSDMYMRDGAGLVGSITSELEIKNSFTLNRIIVDLDTIYVLGNVYDVTPDSGKATYENTYVVDDIEFSAVKSTHVLRHQINASYITRSQAQRQSTYENIGWDFKNTWEFLEGNLYPTLIPMNIDRVEKPSKSEAYLKAISLSKLKVVRTRDFIPLPI